jgi:hypothetical protein
MAGLIRGALAAALIAGLGAGCGGSGAGGSSTMRPSTAKVSATAYVTALCQAVAPFEKAVATHSGALDRSSSSTPAADKAELVAYLTALAKDDDAAVDRLDAAGIPEVDGGSTFAAAILSTFTRVRTALTRSEARAAGLPTSSQALYGTSASQLTSAVKTSLGQLGSGFSKTSNRALDQAAAKVSACHTL